MDSLFGRFGRGERPLAGPTLPSRGQAAELARERERYLRAMKSLAVDAGDEDSVRYYSERLRSLKMLQEEFDSMEAEPREGGA